MKRAHWVACCAIVAPLMVEVARSQEQAIADPFGNSEPSAVGAAQRDERSLLEGPQPTAARADRDLCKCVGESDSESVQKIEQALRSTLKSQGLDFTDVPLEEMVAVLEDNYQIPIEIDIPALDEIGIGPDEPLSISLHGISLRSALRLMLKQLQLTYIIQGEVLMITTPEAAEQEFVVCVYDVRDLVRGSGNAPDFDSLIDAIVSTVFKDAWAKHGGGSAEIRPLKPGLLVISQTQAVHDEVRGLIETLHDARERWPAPGGEAADTSAAVVPDGDRFVTRSYFLQVPREPDWHAISTQIRELITRSLPDARWDRRLEDGQAVVLSVLPDRVIVRHTPAVQQEVESLLSESGIAQPAMAESGPFGRGGGFGGGGFGGGGFGGEGGGGGFFQPGAPQGE